MKYSLGVEFGSTRIKAVLINQDKKVIEFGEYLWENQFIDGYWTYSKEEVLEGLRSCIQNLYDKLEDKTIKADSMGISAMMHGYIALDSNDRMLVPFRTWRNTNTKEAASKLSSLFSFNIPERWSIAHIYQAILNKEEHVKKISYVTTLAGYVHYLLTGNKVLGMDDASGMFPIDSKTKNYDLSMVDKFNSILKENDLPFCLEDILPKAMLAGNVAGKMTSYGANLISCPLIQEGILMAPPEGDAATGMVATNTILAKTGNISVGTSVFLMMVLDKSLEKYYKEIDMVTTPDGLPVAMVHANNCSSEINHWMELFYEVSKKAGANISLGELYSRLIKEASNLTPGVENIIYYNLLSGEPLLNVDDGIPMLLRLNHEKLTLDGFMKSQIYSSMASIAIGMELLRKENISANYIFGHGGLFKSKDTIGPIVASFLKAPLKVTQSSSEGGPFGMALLANYILNNDISLVDYLNESNIINDLEAFYPAKDLEEEIQKYLVNYKKNLHLVSGSVNEYSYQDIQKRVYEANMRLYESGLAPLTWGNVSEIDRNRGIIAIKPSGVPYEKMKYTDIVITNLDGKVIYGDLRPSSDLKTHVVLYKSFEGINAVVHTHSPYATSYAQAGVPIPILGTTHADTFYGDIPCARTLTKEEIEEDYEKNTGAVIVECFKDLDYIAIPGVIVSNHGPFTWGANAKKAVDVAITLERVAQMDFQTMLINQNAKRLDQYIMDKHYYRKHGKNAYYGQGEK